MDQQTLAYMVNQIARNLATQGEAQAIDATVNHIIEFWDPRMKAAIRAADPTILEPIASAAVARLCPRQKVYHEPHRYRRPD